MYMKDKETC